MKLMFNKLTLEPKWFHDVEYENPEDTTGYTDKIPPFSNYVFNEKLNKWELNNDNEKIEENTD